MNSHLLARFAENIFWLARYVERVENLARVLDVNESFARDSRGAHNWLPVLQMNSDEERFRAKKIRPTPSAVLNFYMIDRDNPTSIVSTLSMARENARSIRHLISTEMWTQLNMFHGRVARWKRRDLALRRVSGLCDGIKQSCQAHTGITEGTLYHDEAHSFYAIGKHIERADQTTRLLDIKYRYLLESGGAAGSPEDASQWNTLLRSVAGYHAFRRVHKHGFDPDAIAAFLVFQTRFPRSLAYCVDEIRNAFRRLGGRQGLKETAQLKAGLEELRRLSRRRGNLPRGADPATLHEFADRVQIELSSLTAEVGKLYFGHTEE